jgi:serine/threonine protein kinase
MTRMPSVAPLPDSGQRIGRYQPIRRLAVGGMAEIYLARLPGVGIEGFEKLVVLKRILPQHALDPELLRMFLDESRLSATLTHPHVTEVYDVGTDGEAPFFAMEYVHGANLREIQRAHAKRVKGAVPAPSAPLVTAGSGPHTPLAAAAARSPSGPHTPLVAAAARSPSGPHTPLAAATSRHASGPYAVAAVPLPLAQAVGIVASAAAGLHYAHERLGPGGEPLGIVHRDVSPSNVLVSYDGAVKVSDFGIAKWAYQRTRTQEGTLKGKFAYMSPEQCRGRPVDRRSDVFALGAILYEMTTGAAPFSGASDLDILNQIATGTAAPPQWPDGGVPYPRELSEIVMRALAPDPARRFPTMQALQLALESFARTTGLGLSTVALAAFVQDLFADDLAAWHAAQREGKTLGEHLAARPAATPPADTEDRTATDAFGPTRLRGQARLRWGQAAAMTVVLALSAVLGGFVAKRWSGSGAAPVRAAAASAPPTLPGAPAPPVTPTPASYAAGPGVPLVPAVAVRAVVAPEPAGAPAKARSRARARAAAAPASAPHPTPESRLKAWDPDSPVPP